MHLEDNINKRRTFAIIAHPDAGKTTLTEKLLLFGGAIQLAGAVKARGDQRRARSDWMKVEKERGISVTSSVMTFEYKTKVFNPKTVIIHDACRPFINNEISIHLSIFQIQLSFLYHGIPRIYLDHIKKLLIKIK